VTGAPPYDVMVLGEVLVELSSPEPLRHAREFALSFSGDALNAAAAAAAAGATVGLLARVGDDELGDAIVDRVAELGIDPAPIRRVAGQNGIYFVSHDPAGQRDFVYARRASAGSTLGPDDIDATVGLAASSVLVASGITQALSASCAAAVERAVAVVREAGGTVVYDPNFRSRLTTPGDARRALARVAGLASLITPSCPADSLPLLGTDEPAAAARACLALGARAAAITCGDRGVVFADGRRELAIDGVRAPRVVDATGAGDVFTGTVAARLALGDEIEDALRLGVAAASLSLAGRGGAGAIPSLAQTREALT
jgi:2-dehydro-3-deoxygluconokinase